MSEGGVAVVTGGGSGLGRATAERLAGDGFRVVLTDVDAAAGAAAADELGLAFEPHDVTDEGEWARVLAAVEERHGGLRVLVNNAGILGPMDAISPEDTRLEDWRRIFAVNVEGVFLGCRAAIGPMRRAGGGAIINIASIAGLLATPYATAYGASKATVRQLTRSVAQHCAEAGFAIRCNAVNPGNVKTPLWMRQAEERATARGIATAVLIEEEESVVPIGELITAEEVAAAVAFLASDAARRMTGAELVVDGGFVSCDTYRATCGNAGT
jgi:3(or 17)beta-hydroxysteroid dehydrogenase